MSRAGSFRRHALLRQVATPSARDFWRRVLTPEQFAELPEPGAAVCGKVPPDGSGAPAACIFRVGHTCPCRYFGKLEGG